MACVVMVHNRVLVKLQSCTVPCQFAHHAVAVFMGVFANRFADVTDKTPRLCSFHTNLQAFFGHFDQTFHLRVDIANHKHS